MKIRLSQLFFVLSQPKRSVLFKIIFPLTFYFQIRYFWFHIKISRHHVLTQKGL